MIMFKNWIKILVIGFLFVLLIGVRFFESYFYDPLQDYFEYDYLHISLPNLNTGKLLFHVFLRYTLNTLLSLAIIWIAFHKKSYLKFSGYFYAIAFIILLIIFYTLAQINNQDNNMLLFYVRRFLIQPLFILLLLPAFYYQEHQK